MKPNYSDIRSRIPMDPIWFDEHGVPRYEPFAIEDRARAGAQEVALVRIVCQCCGMVFRVCMTWTGIPDGPRLSTLIPARLLEYKDPPNIECCPAGPTMMSVALHVEEFWEHSLNGSGARPGLPTWGRVSRFELDCRPAWADDLVEER